MLPKNIRSLHHHEESIRTDSLKHIEADATLLEHVELIHRGMSIVYAFTHDHPNENDDELTVQYLGIRVFNTAASSMKLAVSGYYQPAFSLVRDLFETVALLDYLRSNREQIAVWKTADRKTRQNTFGPAAIRQALDRRDGFEGKRRMGLYILLSEYAAHATAPSFRLVMREGLGEIGPYYSDKLLKAWVEETVKLMAQGGAIFMSHFEHVAPALLVEKAGFLAHLELWRNKYLAG